MASFVRTAMGGAAAGAAGTTALNAVTYPDMAVRGGPAAPPPGEAGEKRPSAAGLEVPGDDETRRNRLAGLGPLTGIATGVGVGVLAVLLAPRLSLPVLAGAFATAAMAGANGPMTVLGITDPRSWDAASWISDVVPHLAYGIVTAAVAKRLIG